MGGNVELIHRATDCFNRSDWNGMAELLGEETVLTPLENWPEPGPFVGKEAVLRQYQRLRQGSSGRSKIEPTEVTERGDWVIVRYRWMMEGEASGAVVEAELNGALRVQNGKAVEAHFRFDESAAFEAAGLSTDG